MASCRFNLDYKRGGRERGKEKERERGRGGGRESLHTVRTRMLIPWRWSSEKKHSTV